ncbi:hypothetical protein [Marinoscillum sp. MHG1-6]|uniref:hypothetical protein n=1 Tax=Marinoscillum sp. MHG1-6 TaxID=2959627 RepID=UPI002157F505|nr:hypothetical protein [Marinoscillum sp. MHG1-6]
MKNLISPFWIAVLIFSCSEVSKEKRPLVKEVSHKVAEIDANHRVQIIEDDFHEGDSVYKVRGYFMEGILLKLVGVLYTSDIERDDYFYFENGAPIFSGHVVVSKESKKAAEYKYYYGNDGYVEEALFWEDFYTQGRRFPHEHFNEFEPDRDSLKRAEEERLQYFLGKLEMEGYEVRHLNENLDANATR